jgi:hypothetical protein
MGTYFLLRQKVGKKRPLPPVTPSGRPVFEALGRGPRKLTSLRCVQTSAALFPPKRLENRHGQKGVTSKLSAGGVADGVGGKMFELNGFLDV